MSCRKKVCFSDVYILHSVGSSDADKEARRNTPSNEERDRIRFMHNIEDWIRNKIFSSSGEGYPEPVVEMF